MTFPAPRLIIFGAIDFAAQLCTLARTSGWRPYVVDPRGLLRAHRALPRRRGGRRRVAGGGVRRARRHRPRDSIAVLTHDPKLDDAALEHRAALRRRLRRRDGLAPRAGQAPRPARRAGHHRRGARAPGRADRPRPRRADAGGDRAVDHGRDRGPCAAAARAAGCRTRGGRIHEVAPLDRRRRARRGRGARFGSPKQLAELDGVALLQHAIDAMLGRAGGRPRRGRARRRGGERPPAVDFGGAGPVVCPDWAGGHGGVAALRRGPRGRVRLGARDARRPAARDARRSIAARHGPRRVGRRPAPWPCARRTTAGRATPWRSACDHCSTASATLRGDVGARELLATPP